MRYLYALIVVALLAGALEWHGHSRGYDDGVAATMKDANKRINKAQDDMRLALAERDATTQTLDNVQRSLDAQKRQLQTAQFFADAAIAERFGLQQKLKAAVAARENNLRKAAHESLDCTDLARLPVCPVVAERLWGLTPNPAPSESGGGTGASLPRH